MYTFNIFSDTTMPVTATDVSNLAFDTTTTPNGMSVAGPHAAVVKARNMAIRMGWIVGYIYFTP